MNGSVCEGVTNEINQYQDESVYESTRGYMWVYEKGMCDLSQLVLVLG